MKIVQVISSLGKGGAERLTVDLCNQLALIPGTDVFLCVYYENANQPSFKNELNAKVHYINLSKKGKIDLAFQLRLIRVLFKIKPDVVNSHLSGAILYLYLPIRLFNRIRFFHTIHNLAEEETPGDFLQKMRKRAYLTNKLIPVSISAITQESHSRLYGIDSELVYNGVKKQGATERMQDVQKEIESYKQNNDTKVFLSIGRINSPKNQKNYKLLVEVFNELYHHQINAVLIVIGADNSSDQQTLNSLLKLKQDNVFFIGSKDNISDYMICASFYCLSSIFEGLPITIIEALSYGLPVISTKVGGIPELIEDHVNGLLVEELTLENYYQKTVEMIQWPEAKIEEMKKVNQEKYEQYFSIDKASEKYYDMYLKYTRH